MAELSGPRWGPASKGAARQLVVLCHGVGADGHDLIDLAPRWAQALPDAVFVSPDGPAPYDMAPMGRQWFSLADRRPEVMQAGAQAAAPALLAFIDAELARLGLASDQVALAGFSQGAMMALYAGLRRRPAPRPSAPWRAPSPAAGASPGGRSSPASPAMPTITASSAPSSARARIST